MATVCPVLTGAGAKIRIHLFSPNPVYKKHQPEKAVTLNLNMSGNSKPVTLKVEGMDCANCALGITRKLTKDGHGQVQVDFATGEACFVVSEKSSLEQAIGAIEGLGYHVVRDEQDAGKGITVVHKFWFCLVFTIPLFFGHMLFPHDSFLARPMTQLVLCLPVFLVGAWHFGKSAWGSVRSGVANMDVLIFTGSTAAFGYSLAGIFLYSGHEVHQYMFFETAATIITLVLLGNLFEHISVKRTTTAIRELTALQPQNARRISQRHGEEYIETVPVSQLQPGDILAVNAGESIPADGTVSQNSGTADESMITGESTPAEKIPGSAVTGGTILLSGPVRIKVTRTGSESTLSRIISLVKQAQHEKPPVQQLADRISAIFVPIVLGIALLTFLLAFFAFGISAQQSLMNSIAVLVISCPCAMGLATPTAVMVGIGRAARNGILIRGGRTLEQLAGIRTIVFDKTGTLTTGKFSSLEINPQNGFDALRLKEILLAAEQHSGHPLARSIVALLEKEKIRPAGDLRDLRETKGLGIAFTDSANMSWQIGSWRIAGKEASGTDADIFMLCGDRIAGELRLRDEIRPEMKSIITFFRQNGIRTVLLSGDRKKKCEEVAATLGIDEVMAERLPEEKSEIVAQLSKESSVAMVGDGINDAPALARAGVGIAPGDASQVAMQSAQVVLLGADGLRKLSEAVLIGRHSLKTIRQNLFWAFFYNVIAIPIAAAGLLNPMIAALSMAFSDVIVIGNSIRLRTKRLS